MYAEEAKKIADKAQWVKNDMDHILASIKNAASAGKYEIEMSNLSPWAISQLRHKFGYNVKTNSYTNYSIISFSKVNDDMDYE